MATSDDSEYYWRIYLLHHEGSSLISKQVLSREVEKRGDDLDNLLLKNKEQLVKIVSISEAAILFPEGKKTNTEQWKTDLFPRVILTLFSKTLPQTERQHIRGIQNVQKDIANLPEPSLDPETYADLTESLSQALRELARVLSRETETKISKLVNVFIDEPFNVANMLNNITKFNLPEEIKLKLTVFLQARMPLSKDNKWVHLILYERTRELDSGNKHEHKIGASSASVHVPEVVLDTKQIQRYDTRKQGKELYSSGESDGETGTESFASVSVTKRTRRHNTRKQNRKVDEPRSTDLASLGESDGEDSTSSLEFGHNAGIGNALLSQKQIDSLWAKQNLTAVLLHCNDICAFIKKKSNSILDVWPAYNIDGKRKSNVCFVVETEDEKLELTDVDYTICLRNLNQYSDENMQAIQNSADRKRLTSKEAEEVRRIINKHAKDLLQKHSQLSMISANEFRSKGYGKNHEIIPGKTIVMYVKVKGKVPLREDELPRELDGIPVDVMEGGFKSTSLDADKKLPNLRIGCQISSNGKSGSLGAFVYLPKYGLCGTTCAHCVLSDSEMETLIQNGGKKIWEDDTKVIYQPNNSEPPVGRVIGTILQSGEDDKSGVDLAVFQIEDRTPNSGKFPSFRGKETDVVYESGRICEKSPFLHNRQVFKFGYASGLTEGVVKFSGAVCKSECAGIGIKLIFMNTFEVSSKSGERFCLNGDSGALVFQKGVGNDLVCIGMVIGTNTTNGNGLIGPISEIKEELGVSEFETFKWSGLKERMDLIGTQIKTLQDK